MSLQLPRPARLTGGLAAAALLFGAAACGDSTETASAAEVPVDAEICELLTFDEIEDAVGQAPAATSSETTRELAEGETKCFWVNADDDLLVSLTRWAPPADTGPAWEQQTTGLIATGEEPPQPIADDAQFQYAAAGSLGGLVFRSGEAVYLVSMSNRTGTQPPTSEMESEAREPLVDLAEDVLTH